MYPSCNNLAQKDLPSLFFFHKKKGQSQLYTMTDSAQEESIRCCNDSNVSMGKLNRKADGKQRNHMHGWMQEKAASWPQTSRMATKQRGKTCLMSDGSGLEFRRNSIAIYRRLASCPLHAFFFLIVSFSVPLSTEKQDWHNRVRSSSSRPWSLAKKQSASV